MPSSSTNYYLSCPGAARLAWGVELRERGLVEKQTAAHILLLEVGLGIGSRDALGLTVVLPCVL